MSELSRTLDRPRRRHRSDRRRLVDSLMLVLGVPSLIFLVLALSVELIEYEPDPQATGARLASAPPAPPAPVARPAARPTAGLLPPLESTVEATPEQPLTGRREPPIAREGHAGSAPRD